MCTEAEVSDSAMPIRYRVAVNPSFVGTHGVAETVGMVTAWQHLLWLIGNHETGDIIY